jgi:hypothetical protein
VQNKANDEGSDPRKSKRRSKEKGKAKAQLGGKGKGRHRLDADDREEDYTLSEDGDDEEVSDAEVST